MKRRQFVPALAAVMLLTGCMSGRTYEDLPAPAYENSTLQPVGDYSTHHSYEGVPAVREETLASYRSKDGICRIDAKAHYYDVTLDMTGGDAYAVGAAYAEALEQLPVQFEQMTEDYLYDTMNTVYRSADSLAVIGSDPAHKTELIAGRVHTLKAALPARYRQEMDGFASQFSGGDTGFVQDGRLSQDEADLLHLIPDVLRETACSGITVNGSRTVSGKRLTARLMEWDLGRENAMTAGNCVVHFRNGDHSVTSVTSLGLLDIITGANDDGVFAAVLFVGSREELYDCTGKISYTYAVREALETCTTARECGEYMNRRAPGFPYNHNVFITDENSAFVAEDCHTEYDGVPLLRDESTPLLDTLEWDAPDCLCVVNAFAAKGQGDQMTGTKHNILRWEKYRRLFSGTEKLSLERFKTLMTAEKAGTEFTEIRGNGLVFLLIADYDTHTLQAAFTGREGVADMPDFLDLGVFY